MKIKRTGCSGAKQWIFKVGGWLKKKKGGPLMEVVWKKLPPQGPILFGYAVLSIYVIADDGIDNILIFPLL